MHFQLRANLAGRRSAPARAYLGLLQVAQVVLGSGSTGHGVDWDSMGCESTGFGARPSGCSFSPPTPFASIMTLVKLDQLSEPQFSLSVK